MALHKLLLEHLHQLLELLARLGVHKVVVLEALDRAAEIFRQLVELVLLLSRHPLEHLLELLGVGILAAGDLLAALFETPLDALPLGFEDVLQLLLEVLDDVRHAVAVELLFALLAEPLEQIAQAGHLVAFAVLGTPAQHPLQGALQVAVGHQVVGHRRQQIVGVEVR